MKRFKINKRSNRIYNIVVVILVAGIIFFSHGILSAGNNPLGHNYSKQKGIDNLDKDNDTVEEDVTGEARNKGDFISDIWTKLKGISLIEPTFILSSQMPYLNTGEKDGDFVNPEKPDDSIAVIAESKEDASRQIQRKDKEDLDKQVSKDNMDSKRSEEEIPGEIQIHIKGIDNTEENSPPITLQGEGPQILIYHTHSREAYRQDPDNPYKAIEIFRSNDFSQTVVGVGDELSRELERRGLSVFHDRTDHEVYPWKSGLYPRSLETIEKRQKEYKSLKVFLDIHRNYNESLKDPDKEVIMIDGERVAKFFILIGTANGVSGGFDAKPKWKENYQFALKVTNKANEKYPGFANNIMVRTGRYNQHVSSMAILIEVGNHMTTFAEAKRSAKYIAEVLSEIIE